MEKIQYEIVNIEEKLNSDSFVSDTVKQQLTEKLQNLKFEKQNLFPSLNKLDTSNEPELKNNTIWSNVSSKVKSNEGVEEANYKTKKKLFEKEKLKKEAEKQKKQIYEEYVESDYEGDDFIDDDDEEFYDDDL